MLGSKEEWNGKEVASKEIKEEQRKTDSWKRKQTKQVDKQTNKKNLEDKLKQGGERARHKAYA